MFTFLKRRRLQPQPLAGVGVREVADDPTRWCVDDEGNGIYLMQLPDGQAVMIHTFRDSAFAPLVVLNSSERDLLAEYQRYEDLAHSQEDPTQPCWHSQCVVGRHPHSALHTADYTGSFFVQPWPSTLNGVYYQRIEVRIGGEWVLTLPDMEKVRASGPYDAVEFDESRLDLDAIEEYRISVFSRRTASEPLYVVSRVPQPL